MCMKENREILSAIREHTKDMAKNSLLEQIKLFAKGMPARSKKIS